MPLPDDIATPIETWGQDRFAAGYAQGKTDGVAEQLADDQVKFDQMQATIDKLTKRPMLYGVSNSTTVGDYTGRQAPSLHARCLYWYGQATSTWSLSSVPAEHDVWLQSLATTAAAADALVKSLPETRAGRVFLHGKNEPEDNYPAPEFVGYSRVLYDAVDRARAAGRPLTYVVKAVELNGYTLVRGLDERPYVPAGCEHVGWSVYGGVGKDSAGHATWGVGAQRWADLLKAANDTIGLPWSAAAVGLGYTSVQLADPVARKNRADGLVQLAAALEKAGSQHFPWYDRLMPPDKNGVILDYRFSSDPNLTAAWLTLA